MKFFDTAEPYQIADKITSEHELSPDLVAHVYEIMTKRSDIENEPAFFARCAYQQWTWSNSEFNRLHNVNGIRLFEDFEIEDISEEVIIHNGEKYMDYLRKYLNQTPPTQADWFKIEICKMTLEGYTYREIEAKIKLNKSYITETLKQLRNDIFNAYYSECDRDDIDNLSDAGH